MCITLCVFAPYNCHVWIHACLSPCLSYTLCSARFALYIWFVVWIIAMWATNLARAVCLVPSNACLSQVKAMAGCITLHSTYQACTVCTKFIISSPCVSNSIEVYAHNTCTTCCLLPAVPWCILSMHNKVSCTHTVCCRLILAYPWSWYQSVTVAQWWLTTAYNRSVGMDTQVSLLINHKTWAVFWWDKTNRAIASLAVLFQLSMQAGTVYLLACNSDPGGLPGCGFAQFWECVLARWANGLQLVCMDRSVKQDCIKAHCTMTDCSSGVAADIQHNF